MHAKAQSRDAHVACRAEGELAQESRQLQAARGEAAALSGQLAAQRAEHSLLRTQVAQAQQAAAAAQAELASQNADLLATAAKVSRGLVFQPYENDCTCNHSLSFLLIPKGLQGKAETCSLQPGGMTYQSLPGQCDLKLSWHFCACPSAWPAIVCRWCIMCNTMCNCQLNQPACPVLLVQARLAASPWREAPTPRRLLLGIDAALQASDDEQAAVGMLTLDGSQTPAPGAQADPPGSLMGEVARLRLERGALQQALTALQVKCEALLAAMGPGTSCQALAEHCEGGEEDNTEPHGVQVSCADWQNATTVLSCILHSFQ